uniref:Envelope-like protein n=1 Tax=Gongylonema pulchrum TaxID=637853 RepID=A0A183EYN4_9BILA
LISLNVLTSHHWEPNTLIAPTVKANLIEICPSTEDVVINVHFTIIENHILIGRKETEPRDEDKMLLEQVQSIASVNTTENVQKAGRSELDEVNELLEGIEEEFGCAGD